MGLQKNVPKNKITLNYDEYLNHQITLFRGSKASKIQSFLSYHGLIQSFIVTEKHQQYNVPFTYFYLFIHLMLTK